MLRVAEGEHPINLIVEQVQGPIACSLTTRILRDDEVADAGERVGVEQRPRWIEGRVEDEHPRVAHRAREHLRCRQEVRLRATAHHHLLGADELRVVVVVPRRHREHHLVTGIDEHAIRAVDRGPRPARHQHGRESVRQPESPSIKLANRPTQRLDAVRGWIVRLARLERRSDTIEQRLGNGELRRIEVADGEIADGLPRRGERTDLGADRENERAGQLLRDRRHTCRRGCSAVRSRAGLGGFGTRFGASRRELDAGFAHVILLGFGWRLSEE